MPMSTQAPTVGPRGPERFYSKLRMTLATPFSSSTDMTGRDVFWKSVKTDLLTTRWVAASVAVEGLEVVAASVAASAVAEALAAVVGLAAVLEDAVVMVVVLVCMVVVAAMMPALLSPRLLLTPSPTMPPRAPRRTRPSTFATYVFLLDVLYRWSLTVSQLPWSTSNEDLVELFSTIGKVEQAEIQYEPSGRSRGTGVVRFDNADTAETAITKFQGYQYGGRPLGLSFVKYIQPGSEAMDTDPHGGLTQDQLM